MTATTTTATALRPTLEELVDRLIDAIFGLDEPAHPATCPARAIHEARHLGRAGDLDGAFAVFADIDLSSATEGERRWAYAEFLGLARRQIGDVRAQLYNPGIGRAAVLTPCGEGTLEVRAVLDMRWRPVKRVSRRSLRGLKPLAKGGAS